MAGRRIDPGTGRLDRQRRARALRVRPPSRSRPRSCSAPELGDAEVVAQSPSKPAGRRRPRSTKTLAMTPTSQCSSRSDEALRRGRSARPRRPRSPPPLRRERSGPRPLRRSNPWTETTPASAPRSPRHLRLPLISQVVAAPPRGGGAQQDDTPDQFGYEQILGAMLPAVVAVSDAISQPRCPSLSRGSWARRRTKAAGAARRRRGQRRVPRPPAPRVTRAPQRLLRARGAAARPRRPGRCGRRGDRRLPGREAAAVSGTLVFLEHHGRGGHERTNWAMLRARSEPRRHGTACPILA